MPRGKLFRVAVHRCGEEFQESTEVVAMTTSSTSVYRRVIQPRNAEAITPLLACRWRNGAVAAALFQICAVGAYAQTAAWKPEKNIEIVVGL
ncbi:MAG TPA: hypothetical protein VN689_03285, partial [Burkholderiales bacterium]|nr:hypothetical protein [Burkholderiales bacterium]